MDVSHARTKCVRLSHQRPTQADDRFPCVKGVRPTLLRAA